MIIYRKQVRSNVDQVIICSFIFMRFVYAVKYALVVHFLYHI
uniref:Uncharacterized protein n=1 Tax=Nelumbo nucifera TaxID=4432 RepID=A0A822XXK0_NELNU|nr:TPA_asm: hypothetical protein HUJ06_025199 [Nelumbo nucifera]